MRALCALLVTLCAFALAAAACGGGGGGGGGGGTHPLSKSDYEKAMSKLGNTLTASFQSLGGVATRPDPKVAAAGIDKAANLLDQAGDSFAAINPPRNIAAAHQKLVDGSHQAAKDFRKLADEIRKGDINLQQRFDASTLKGFRKIQAGFNEIRAKGYNLGAAAG
jgi:hypothetical protein